MLRPASGDDHIWMNARQAIASAQTLEQLRQAQGGVLPLDCAMSLADTAQLIGVSPCWNRSHVKLKSQSQSQARTTAHAPRSAAPMAWARMVVQAIMGTTIYAPFLLVAGGDATRGVYASQWLPG